ncbi:MAG: hypothetical protein ACE5MI_06725 [Acidimicrobiia bacterium]
MPSLQLSHPAEAATTLEEAWRRLQKAATWEAIPGVDRVFEAHHDPEGNLLGFGFEATAGGTRYQGTAMVRAAHNPNLMKLDVDASEVKGWIRTELSEITNNRIAIVVTLMLEATGFLSTLFFNVLQSTVQKGLPQSVEEFAARLSEG